MFARPASNLSLRLGGQHEKDRNPCCRRSGRRSEPAGECLLGFLGRWALVRWSLGRWALGGYPGYGWGGYPGYGWGGYPGYGWGGYPGYGWGGYPGYGYGWGLQAMGGGYPGYGWAYP